jgi:hypothetical protein
VCASRAGGAASALLQDFAVIRALGPTLFFATLCVLLGLAAVSAHGQASVRVEVPFDFVVADRTLPGGEYLISSIREKVFIQNSGGETIAVVLSNAVGGRLIGRPGQVVFKCYRQHCFLSEVWMPTHYAGRLLLKSRWEKEVAKKDTRKYFALAAKDSLGNNKSCEVGRGSPPGPAPL